MTPTGGGCARPRATRQPANTGPAISPTTNPPYPENPVNGAPAPDGAGVTSTAVDFWPYRSGPQGDPNTGQHGVMPAPIPVDDTGALRHR